MDDARNPDLCLLRMRDEYFAARAEVDRALRNFEQTAAAIDEHLRIADVGVYRIKPGCEITYQLEADGEVFRDTVREVTFMGQMVRTGFGDWVGFSQIKGVYHTHLKLVQEGA